jgi:GDP-L-fucose synthase
MKVLVTGGAGFLGSHLINKLNKDGIENFAPTRSEIDLTNLASIKSLDINFTHIFHLAAHTQAGDWCLTHPGEQWIINQQINTNMLSWWKEFQPGAKLISIGTSCSYAPGVAMIEENYFTGEPIDSLFTYAMTKRMLLQGQRALSQQFGLNYIHVVPSTLYGPSYHLDGRQMHFIFDLIRKILRGKYFYEEVELWGDGSQRRELIHVEDFISNLMALVNRSANGEFNLGAGVDYSIKDYAEMISRVVNFNADSIKYNESKYVGAKTKLLDITKAKTFLDFYSNRNLEVGIKETIEWFIDSGAYLR